MAQRDRAGTHRHQIGGFSARRSFAAGALGLALLIELHGAAQSEPAKALAPIPPATLALLAKRDTSAAAPLVFRTYKKEGELEIWKLNRSGRFVYVKTFPICRWSGQLGPKRYPGDRQTPEGFYEIGPRQMNPYSHYYLSFDVGFPNAYDRAHGATGSAVMVHGTCSSMGCFAMTDKQVGEIYALARDALKGGQSAIQLQSFPFHMTARNMALYRRDPNFAFWSELKQGSDRFEATGEPLRVDVVDGHYIFAPSNDATKEARAQAFHQRELAETDALVAAGSAAITTLYADGGQTRSSPRCASVGPILGPSAVLRRWPMQPSMSRSCRPIGIDRRCRPVPLRLMSRAGAPTRPPRPSRSSRS
jgi:murein L,D-transpeptidase YafK